MRIWRLVKKLIARRSCIIDRKSWFYNHEESMSSQICRKMLETCSKRNGSKSCKISRKGGLWHHKRRVQFEGCAGEPLQTITAILPGSKLSRLLLRIVLQDALSEVTQFYPPPRLRVFVDDITAFINVRNKSLVEMTEKVFEKS